MRPIYWIIAAALVVAVTVVGCTPKKKKQPEPAPQKTETTYTPDFNPIPAPAPKIDGVVITDEALDYLNKQKTKKKPVKRKKQDTGNNVHPFPTPINLAPEFKPRTFCFPWGEVDQETGQNIGWCDWKLFGIDLKWKH
jgi:hypothetical protein